MNFFSVIGAQCHGCWNLAMGLSFALSHYLEGMIIFVLLTINAIIGQIHSGNSQKVIELLRKKLAIKAKILRNKIWFKEDAKGIVDGDIISVKLGDIVPADARIINGELSVDQSALTGESMPLRNTPVSDIIYSGSIVRQRRSYGYCYKHRNKYLFWKNNRAGKNCKTKVTSAGSNDGCGKIHDVSWYSCFRISLSICFTDAFKYLNNIYIRSYFSFGSNSGSSSGSSHHCTICRGNESLQKKGHW